MVMTGEALKRERLRALMESAARPAVEYAFDHGLVEDTARRVYFNGSLFFGRRSRIGDVDVFAGGVFLDGKNKGITSAIYLSRKFAGDENILVKLVIAEQKLIMVVNTTTGSEAFGEVVDVEKIVASLGLNSPDDAVAALRELAQV